MYPHKIFIIFLFLGLFSCDTIFSKKQEITPQNKFVLKPIDFKTIDAYPLLPECKELSSRVEQKKCFYDMLSKRIQESLNKKPILLDSKDQGIVIVKLQVTTKGEIKISSITMSEKIKENHFKLDSLIRISVVNIPPIIPAIKAGIPVKSEYTLPIVINKEN